MCKNIALPLFEMTPLITSIGLLVLFTQPFVGWPPRSSSERWQGPCEQFASAVQISVSDAKHRCCKKCGCEFRQNFPDPPVL